MFNKDVLHQIFRLEKRVFLPAAFVSLLLASLACNFSGEALQEARFDAIRQSLCQESNPCLAMVTENVYQDEKLILSKGSIVSVIDITSNDFAADPEGPVLVTVKSYGQTWSVYPRQLSKVSSSDASH